MKLRAYSTHELQEAARASASRFGVPYDVLQNVITRESSWNPYAVSGTSTATGIAQVLEGTARQPGYGVAPLENRFDPFDSLRFASQYLRAMYDRTGSWSGAQVAYNQGLGYALANPGAVPYGVQTAGLLNVSTSGQATTSAGPSVTGPMGASWFGCTGWIATPTECVQEAASRFGLVILAIVLLGLAGWAVVKRM